MTTTKSKTAETMTAPAPRNGAAVLDPVPGRGRERHLGELVHRLRHERGLTRAGLAELVGRSPLWLHDVEEDGLVSVAMACRLAAALDVERSLHPEDQTLFFGFMSRMFARRTRVGLCPVGGGR